MEEGDKVTGDFADALYILIDRLVRAKNSSKLATELLQDWDERRGNDWFTDTRSRQQKVELLELKRLKMKYE